MHKLFTTILILAALQAGCSDTSPSSAKESITNLGNGVIENTENAKAMAQTGAQKMESFGNSVTATVTYVGQKVEGLGNLVIEATGTEPSKPESSSE